MSRPLVRFPNYIFRLLTTHPEQRKVEFQVPKNLTKIEIANYLRAVYDFDVVKVNTLIRAGERTRNRYGQITKTKDVKKAIVTLATDVPKMPEVGE